VVTKLLLYPNPVINAFTLAYTTAASKSIINIYTTDGRHAASYLVAIGSTQQTVDVSALPTGKYVVVFNNGKDRNSTVFVK